MSEIVLTAAEGEIKGLIEVTVKGSCLMEIDASIETFLFERYVIGSTRRCTIVDKFVIMVSLNPITKQFPKISKIRSHRNCRT